MNELEQLKQLIQEKDKIIKDLTLQLIGYKKENKNLIAKLKRLRNEK